MKNLFKLPPIFVLLFPFICNSAYSAASKLDFIPISHASFVILAGAAAIYVDPTGDPESYAKIQPPDIILITHGHHDHFDKTLINQLKTKSTTVIGPKTVIDELTYGQILNNGESKTINTIKIEAIPAYNTTPDRLAKHPKGEDNGYVVTALGKRTYISGDTEDTPEMRALKNIDYAFICMNLPFTMSPEQAASAVLEFKPKTVYPYHYRQRPGFADINKFKALASKNKAIKVQFLKWYK